ncbi:Asparagine synthetase protein [Rutstroemia sp. NJR-2017a WRK4]|nr:Asparagine synthetase protein [Rutstroemia sp. NJR-2017a WRK4]
MYGYKPTPRTPWITALCTILLLWSLWVLDVPGGRHSNEQAVNSSAGDEILEPSVANVSPKPIALPQPIISPKPKDRPLILYAYTESDHSRINLKFFISHGLHAAADFIFILNGETNASSLIPKEENIKYVERQNDCYDLGSYAEVLTKDNLYKKYKKFIMLNASIRGPYLPYWAQSCWSDVYLDRITATTKLVGMTANCQPAMHVQSMIWATDLTGMETLLYPTKSTIQNLPELPYFRITGPQDAPEELHPPGINSCFHSRNAAVNAEIRAASLMKAAGYESDAMMSAFHGYGIAHDSRLNPQEPKGADTRKSYLERWCDLVNTGDVLWNGAYFGTNVHPFEMIFAKSHRDIDNIALERLTSWMDGSGFSSYKYCKE